MLISNHHRKTYRFFCHIFGNLKYNIYQSVQSLLLITTSEKDRCLIERTLPVQSHTHHEYVVPRSIPITVPTSFLSTFSSFFLSSALARNKLLANAKAQIVQIAFIVKISPKTFCTKLLARTFLPRDNYKNFMTSLAPDG